MRKMLSNREYQNMSDEYDKVKFKCKCGHKVVIPAWVDKQLCGWCGTYVYRNKKQEFTDRLIQRMKGV